MNRAPLRYDILKKYYRAQSKSALQIAKILHCSEHKVNYWLEKYQIQKRTISDAVYARNHPNGDPFKVRFPTNIKDAVLFGLGLGLYWGEGNKKNRTSIRLANSDPVLLKKFIDFLVKICGVRKRDITFNLLIFSDIEPSAAKKFWIRELRIHPRQIRGKITVIKSGRVGNYRQKSQYGVLILQYHNRKLRDIICNLITDGGIDYSSMRQIVGR